jgi:hypothetical protein
LQIFDLSLFRAFPYFLKGIIYNNGNYFFKFYLNSIANHISFFRANFHTKEKKDETVTMQNMINDYKDTTKSDEFDDKINDKKQTENEYDKIKQILNKPLNIETRDIVLLKEIINAKIIDKNCFNYIQLNSPHTPYNVNRDGDYTGNREETYGSYKDKYVYGLKLTYIFLDYLKTNNIYDNSLIIILGDHAAHVGIEYNEKYTISQKNRANPLLLIKPFNRKNNAISTYNNEVSTFDIPSIVFKATNIDDSGEDFLTKENKKRERYHYSVALYRDSDIYEHKIYGNVRDPSSWQSTGKLYTKKGDFSFLDKKPIPKNIFKSYLLDKLKNDDKQFVLSVYNEIDTGYVLKENIINDETNRLIYILTREFNFFR